MASLASRRCAIACKQYGVILVLCLLAACGAPKPKPPTQGARAAPAPIGQPPAGGKSYRINAAQSELRLLVYRGGPMGRLGHNHVILNRTLSGWVSVATPVEKSSFALNVPAANFSVDEQQARMEEGRDFDDHVPDDARSGTVTNMLSPALLDAVHYPNITVRSVSLVPGPGALTAVLAINVAGHESKLTLPMAYESSGGQLSATGEVEITQSALGLMPFSIMMGALQVEDKFLMKFKLVGEAI